MKNTYKKIPMKIIYSLILLILLNISNSFAKEIGIIGFVVGNAFNQDGKKLNVGDPVYFGDTINTEDGGKSQILFIDQTVMTVGSSTELTIDEFIFDPESADGKLLSTIKSGSVKILTGKISEKNPENLVVETPAGTIGTRGTEFKAAVDPNTTKSKILLIGPGPKNSLGLRPGAVEVSNAAGTVLLDKPYLFTEVNQNTAPRQPVIVSQNELKKFQELEIEPEIEVTENEETEETLLAQTEEQGEDIKELIQAEIFGEDEELGDLVLDTLVTALSKDDGGITAQLLGKSFLNSGEVIPRALIPDDVKNELPDGIDINSPEADAFFANELQNEIEKAMLISARIEDVDFVPTEFNQFNAGFNDIKVPVFNDQTGDVVFLEMGDIDFKPQFANFPGDGNNLIENFIPEQIILKGQDGIAIDLEKGQFYEQQIDPQMDALNQRFETALQSGASPEELDQIIFEMDNVMFEANQSIEAFGLASIEGQFGNDFKLDVFTNEEFNQTKESFIFDTNKYSQNWINAGDEGLVPIFQLDGSVTFVEEDQADIAWQEVDQQYEQQFAQQFPEIYEAEKRAEELAQKADQEANLLYSRVDQAIQAGASEEEINELYTKIDSQLNEIYLEVDEAFQQIALAEIKTEVIEIGANEIISESKVEEKELPEEEIKVDRISEVEKKEEEVLPSFELSLRGYLDLAYGNEIKINDPLVLNTESYKIGTTTYSDLNTKTSGTETFTGTSTTLYVDTAGGNAATAVDNPGDTAGSFTPTHTINYSTRTINQGIVATDVQIGSASARDFTIDKDITYNSRSSGNVTPASSFQVDSSSNITDINNSITGDISKTLPSSGYNDGTNANYFVTVESNFENLSGKSFADSVSTTVTVQTKDSDGTTNQISGTSSNGRD